ncbi:MAG: hypothetical protein CM1200mP41_08570 [Gammaproteobacteria bacterium]|nr:MAG: hypothetical protein CM1200mP41_08570 [Gammaproteobacteria bacterium]
MLRVVIQSPVAQCESYILPLAQARPREKAVRAKAARLVSEARGGADFAELAGRIRKSRFGHSRRRSWRNPERGNGAPV